MPNNGFEIDFDFLRLVEGFEIKGYVPMSKGVVIGQSGVTVACGLDLGQQSLRSLADMGLKPSIIVKLSPYVGFKKLDAVRVLKNKPLILSQPEAKEICDKVNLAYAKKIEAMWNKASSTPFKSLNRGCQTVLLSVSYQYGDLSKRTPNFWKVCTSQDWKRAVRHLNNFGDIYKNRRMAEAKFLQQYV